MSLSYRCLDKLLEHREALFTHLQERWKTLFNPRFDVLLYDLTSTYATRDGRTLIFTRYTQPEKDHQLLLQQLKLRLLLQPPPRIAKPKIAHPASCGADS